MNVTPVSTLNSNSHIRNSGFNIQSTKQANINNDFASKNTNLTSIPVSLLQAYNPQISFKGNEPFLSEQEQDSIVDELSYQVDDETKETYGHILAKTNPEEYLKATEGLSSIRKVALLSVKDANGNTVAHELSKADTDEKTSYCLEASKDLDSLERFYVLKRRNNFGNTVAHNLSANNVKSYEEMTKDLPNERQIALLKAFNSEGWSVAHNVVRANADIFHNITKQFTPDEKFEILKLADKYEYTVAHTLAHHRESSFPVITKNLSPDQKFDVLMLTSDVTGTVAQNLYNRNPEMLEFSLEGIPLWKQIYISLP